MEKALEKRVGLLEKALVEQAKVISNLAEDMKKSFEHTELSLRDSLAQLWVNQENQEATLYSVLHSLDPESFPMENAPNKLKESINAEPNKQASPKGAGTQVS